MSSDTNSIVYNSFDMPKVPVLQDFHELLGVLDSVEPAGDGLLRVRIGGLERLVGEEMEGELGGLVGKRVSILRVGDCWSAVEVPA